jgi:hypothetical protein
MEWFIGFLGAVLRTAAGGLSVFLTTRAQVRCELEHAYDQELRTRRMESYMSLYKRTDKLPRYWFSTNSPSGGARMGPGIR